jgi:ribonuclease BN (tRNA processing enzyme)
VTGYLVRHPSGAPAMGLRVACDGRVLAYTGDTEWVDTLIQVGRDADILIAEAYTFDRRIRFHLDLATLREKQQLIGAKRTILTHMSQDMLGRSSAELGGFDVAYDGLKIELSPSMPK